MRKRALRVSAYTCKPKVLQSSSTNVGIALLHPELSCNRIRRFAELIAILRHLEPAQRDENNAAGRGNPEKGRRGIHYSWIAAPPFGRLAMTVCYYSIAGVIIYRTLLIINW